MTESNYLAQRWDLYKKIEEERESSVIAYITGDRPRLETGIGKDVIDIFTSHLDKIFPTRRITLILYTRGGDALAAWNIINLMRMFCDDIEVLVMTKAHSAGTLICLGANRVIMTKQATLSPIDPSVSHPLSPPIPNTTSPFTISVESVRSYIEFAKSEIGSYGKEGLADTFIDLAGKVHPLVLGEVFRSENQMRYLAEELLKHQVSGDSTKRIIEFLTRKSGSHDYTFNRREAEKLGLEIEKPSQPFYDNVIKVLYDNLKKELELETFLDLQSLARRQKNFECIRAVIESSEGGAHAYVTRGTLLRSAEPSKKDLVVVGDRYDGWTKRGEL